MMSLVVTWSKRFGVNTSPSDLVLDRNLSSGTQCTVEMLRQQISSFGSTTVVGWYEERLPVHPETRLVTVIRTVIQYR